MLQEILPLLDKLRRLNQQDIQSLWHYTEDGQSSLAEIAQNINNFPLVTLNEKNHATWQKGCQVRWFIQHLTLPSHLHGYNLEGFSLRLKLTWWAEEAKIYINGELVQEGDLFDSTTRILLTPSVIPHQKIEVAIRLVSPYHDVGGLMESKLLFERENYYLAEPSFIADELTILCQSLERFDSSQLETVKTILQKIEWSSLDKRETFDLRLNQVRNELSAFKTPIKSFCFHLLGHAHLDMAWLWPLSETWDAAQRTFDSVLQLQKDFPYLIFGHTSPIIYDWIEKNRPVLFGRILEAYKANQWEILGGMWVEPDTNLLSGESLIRQLLYGQQYFKEKFGKIAKVAWLTDTFGFTWQLPQIFQQSGIEYFVTGKLHWNDTTEFPYGWFKWRSPDGTEMLTLMSPPNVAGVMDTDPLVMTNYALEWYQKTQLTDIFWLPGVGDHGGGPTRDMLQVQQRWQKSDFFPNIRFSTTYNYLHKITNLSPSLPIWQDELYLELHRGCYTNHADQKGFNRRSEELLYQAELWASLANILVKNNAYTYPKETLEMAWKKVLLNQFHDILPGTSIPEVFQEANQDWQTVQEEGNLILAQALEAITHQIKLPIPPQVNAKPVIIFNSLNWQRSETVTLDLPNSENYTVYDLDHHELKTQISVENQLLFYAKDIPSVGYRLFWLCPQNQVSKQAANSINHPQDFILDNGLLRVIVNSTTGELESIFDKVAQREILRDSGNQLELFQDQGQYWDAWNIDPNYQKYPLSSPILHSIQWLEQGSLRWRIRVIKTFRYSSFTQDYILQANSPLLKISNTVDWQEKHTLLKVAFPLTIQSEFVSYEIPCATIQRTTQGKTLEEKAKWEVSALHWADLSDSTENYGVSLLNDCKYGYDSRPNRLRLTLLRGSEWPDPNSDQGIHYFNYAIYPHKGDYIKAKTVHRGYEFNLPLRVCLINSDSSSPKNNSLVPSASWINLDNDNLILMAFKPAESNSNFYLLRFYECHGEKASLSLKSDLKLIFKQAVNLLEQPLETSSGISPWQIKSVLISAHC